MKKQMQDKQESEAETFTEFTKKLLAVPKKEIDKEKARYEKQRDKEKRSK